MSEFLFRVCLSLGFVFFPFYLFFFSKEKSLCWCDRRTWIFIKRQRSVKENTKLKERRKMEEMKKKKKKNMNNEDSKKKERHIVTWTPEVCDE